LRARGEAASTPYHRRTAAMTKLALFRGESTGLETRMEYALHDQNNLLRGGERKERPAAFPNRKKQAVGLWAW
jgi:hypothetical protein